MTERLLAPDLECTDVAADAELARVLEGYLAEVEAGGAPSAAALMAEHPHLAARLEACLASLQFVERAGAGMGSRSAAGGGADPPCAAGATLGDFRLVREIGRGGMGVVYEAEQISLSRRVAIKVLPFAGMLDERQLARFKNEARAAASLHDPHIVPVYAVGVERGVHYFVMQYIEGQSLAQAIARLREESEGSVVSGPLSVGKHAPAPFPSVGRAGEGGDPGTRFTTPPHQGQGNGGVAEDTRRDAQALLSTRPAANPREYFRTIALLGAQAAEALHHAHECGVVHRDVKPSNLLVECRRLVPRDGEVHLAERDGYKLWVADFGLARIGADATVTVSGDLLGTLRYMSPEQLRGKAAMVDHRTDVYSLGATLYELATGRPAFASESSEHLLDQILNVEPPAPRSLCAALPVDLETIILKAMRKDAADRYGTAEELAADLRRFVNSQPIEARRPSTLDRMATGLRRHAALAAISAGALTAIAVIGVAAALFTLRAWRAEADQRLRAEENLRLAAESVDRMLSRVADDHRTAGDLQRAETLAIDATEFYEKLLSRSRDAELAVQAADAYEQVAVIWTLIQQYEKAATARRRAKTLLSPLAVASARPERQAALADNYAGQGEIAYSLGDYESAEADLEHALAIYRQLARQHPQDVRFDVAAAGALTSLGQVHLAANRLDEAEIAYARAAAIESTLPAELKQLPEYWEREGGALARWAMLVSERGDHDRALAMCADSIDLQRRAFKQWNQDPADHACYRLALSNVGVINLEAGRYAAAGEAVDRMLAECPGRLETYFIAGMIRLALSHDDQLDASTADEHRRRAHDLIALAHEASVRTPLATEQLAWFLVTCEDESFRDAPKAVALAEDVVAEVPQRAGAWFTLALARYRTGAWGEAEAALENAVRHSPGGRPDVREWLLLAMLRHQQGKPAEANRWHAKATERLLTQPTNDDDLQRLAEEADGLLANPDVNR